MRKPPTFTISPLPTEMGTEELPAASTCCTTDSAQAKREKSRAVATGAATPGGAAQLDGVDVAEARRALAQTAAGDALGRALAGAVQRREAAVAAPCAACRASSEGKAADAGPASGDEEPTEELEGHAAPALGRLLARVVADRSRAGRAPSRPLLQRLKITEHARTTGTCGARNIQWVFALSKAAPEDGYIVQHIQGKENTQPCPTKGAKKPKKAPATQLEFWEAWLVKKGDTVDWTTTRDKWTDGSVRPASPNTKGDQVTKGTLKFFKSSTTGDLGDFGVASSDPTSAWGPGKVTTSGALPSTPTKPTWWSKKPVEGPVTREAKSKWSCCDADASKHTSTVTSKPK